VAEGAIAELILVHGDPVADISLIARAQESFLAIIDGGQLVKGPDTPSLARPRPALPRHTPR